MMTDLSIRVARPADEPFLRQMQYEALFVPPGEADLPFSVVDAPNISRYYMGFGSLPGDAGRIASIDGQDVGAAWLRRLTTPDRGYGHVDDETPELGIAVVEARRGCGIGTALLADLLHVVPRASLCVDRRNPAVRLYERFGFELVRRDGHSLVMLRASQNAG